MGDPGVAMENIVKKSLISWLLLKIILLASFSFFLDKKLQLKLFACLVIS